MTIKTIGAALALTLCAAPALASGPGEKDWRFGDGVTPERWSSVNSAYALCDAGLNQSPIDLGQSRAVGHLELDVNFMKSAGTIALGLEKVQVDFPAGQGMVSGGKAFDLVQVHFHTPSEHAINGKRHPLVAHFVHATKEGELGVLGVMFKEGAANGELQKIVDGVKAGKGSKIMVDSSKLLPAEVHPYRYMGSLTTPPCSEGVNWHVADMAIEASASQIAAMRAALGGDTARSLQPLGGRLLVAPAR